MRLAGDALIQLAYASGCFGGPGAREGRIDELLEPGRELRHGGLLCRCIVCGCVDSKLQLPITSNWDVVEPESTVKDVSERAMEIK